MIDLQDAKIITDTALFREHKISQRAGRRRMKELAEQGVIEPLQTPTGRTFLSFSEVQIIWDRLGLE